MGKHFYYDLFGQLFYYSINRLVNKILENGEKQLLKWSKAQVDVFKCLVLYDEQAKKQQILAIEKLESEVEKWHKQLSAYQNDANSFFPG